MENVVTVVSGLPRSGTSMMMNMLSAGGLEVATDRARGADEDNPRGYFELEAVKAVKEDASWLEGLEGKAVKMVSQLLRDLPLDRRYKVVFMRRDLGEILASQRVMLGRMGREEGLPEERMGELYARHLREIESWLAEQPMFEVKYVDYRDVLQDPAGAARAVSEFLGGRCDPAAMAAVVDRGLHRQRSSGAVAASAPEAPGAGDESDQARIEERLRSLGYM